MWNYLRLKVKESVLAGFNDALVELDGTSNGEISEAAQLLRARLAPALPAPEEPVKRGRKGGGE